MFISTFGYENVWFHPRMIPHSKPAQCTGLARQLPRTFSSYQQNSIPANLVIRISGASATAYGSFWACSNSGLENNHHATAHSPELASSRDSGVAPSRESFSFSGICFALL